MQTTAATRVNISIGLYEIIVLLSICFVISGILTFFLGKICRQKRYVALIGFLSGFIVNTVVVIYFWVKGFSWKEPASNSAETLSVLGWSDSVLNIIIFMFCPIICLILALITLSIRKSRDEEKRITSEMQGLLATSTRRNQELGTKNSAKKQKRLAAEMKNGNDDTPG